MKNENAKLDDGSGLPTMTCSVSLEWFEDAVIMLEIFAGCIHEVILPSKCSDARKKLDAVLAESGQRTTPVRRVPRRAEIGKAHDQMVTALQIINTWASLQDGIGLTPKHVIKLTEKALAMEKAARINLSSQNVKGEHSEPKRD